jgi:hypothetical protein
MTLHLRTELIDNYKITFDPFCKKLRTLWYVYDESILHHKKCDIYIESTFKIRGGFSEKTLHSTAELQLLL